MAPLFWLDITDWKKDGAQVCGHEPTIDPSFSSNWKKTLAKKNSFEAVKYFDNELDFDVNKVNVNFKLFFEKTPTLNYDPFKLFSDFLLSLRYVGFNLITSRSVVSRIMNTPFEINQDKRKWIIKAEMVKDNAIHLYYDQDQEHKVAEEMAKQYEVLKRRLFVKSPVSHYRKVTSVFDKIFGQLFFIKFETFDLNYTAEIPGVISARQITNKPELVAAEHIYFDIYEDGEFSRDIINYNPIWWSKAVLSRAKYLIIASYDKENDSIKEIHKFNIDKFEDKTKYENLWSPDAAWGFLNDFVQFVVDSVNSVSDDVKKKCVWKFQSFPNDEPLVSCEILIRNNENDQETLTPISLDETNFP